MSLITKLWQDYDCPHAFDFDLFGDDMVYLGQRFPCSGCGGDHVAGDPKIPIQTYVVRDTGEMECLPLPVNEAALLALRAEVEPDTPQEPR